MLESGHFGKCKEPTAKPPFVENTARGGGGTPERTEARESLEATVLGWRNLEIDTEINLRKQGLKRPLFAQR